MIVDRVKHIFKLAQVRCRDLTKGLTTAGFHMASLKFKVNNLNPTVSLFSWSITAAEN